MDTPFSTEEAAQTDKSQPVWNPWQGPVSPHWYSGLGFNEETAYAGPAYRVLEGMGSAAAKVDLLLKKSAAQVTTNPEEGQKQVELARERVKQLTPDAATTGAATQALHGLSEGATLIIGGGGGFGGAAVVGGTEGGARYDELRQEGVTPGTAGSLAAITSLTSAAGAIVPIGWGSGLLAKMGTGATANVAFGAASRFANHTILEANGYHDMAEQQKVWDGTQVLTDLVLGSAFGVMAHLHTSEKAQIKQLQENPAAHDAALTSNLAAADRRTSPGIPTDSASANAHATALEKASQAILTGDKVDVSGTGIDAATMVPRGEVDTAPLRREFAQHLSENGLLDEEANLHDLNSLMKPADEPISRALKITHEADETGGHSIKSDNGELILQESGDYLIAKRDDTKPEAQGKGEGTVRMEAAQKLAEAKGLKLASDISLSVGEQGVFRKMAEKGYEVKLNPDAAVNPDTKNLVSNDIRKPVFEIGAKKTESTPVTQALDRYPDMMVSTDQGMRPAREALEKITEEVAQEKADTSKAIKAAVACFGRFQ